MQHSPEEPPWPRLGLGTYELEGDVCTEAVTAALDLGYRHIDTAQGYNNEAQVGQAVASWRGPREEVFITTKVWPDHLVEDSGCVRRSLERLQMDHVDLLLVHWPSQRLEMARVLSALEKAKQHGQTRHIGVSNFPPKMLSFATKLAPLSCNQVEFHPYLQQHDLLRESSAAGIHLMAYSPLARGAVFEDAILQRIAVKHGASPASVAVAWLLQVGLSVIPKASSVKHLEDNLKGSTMKLSEEDLKQILKLNRNQRIFNPSFAPDWTQ